LLVATSVIRNLRIALPQARLVFVAGPYNANAVLDHPDLDEVVTVSLKGPLGPLRALRVIRNLRRQRIDVGLMLSTISHSASAVALARLCGAGFLTGLDDAPYGSTLAQRSYDCVLSPPEDRKVHIVDYNLTLLERLGIPITDRRHVVGVTLEQRLRAETILAEAGLDLDRPILGVQVGGNLRHPERQWSPVHYAAILQRADREMGFQPMMLGLRQDHPSMDQVQALGKTPIPRLVDLPFPYYKAVLSRLTFFLTHDGGPIHVAAGVGVPSFFVFLYTPPWRWAPYGSHVSVWDEYGRVPEPAEVWTRLKPLLGQVLETETSQDSPRESGLPEDNQGRLGEMNQR
jgi:ADP-heptose:LPS heptosyltransferase